MTQKDLGIKAGFSPSTADARIRQYEIGVMNPKEDKLRRIAEVLDVDMSALSDINIKSTDDIMQILFDLESSCGLQMSENDNGQVVFSFDIERCPSDLIFALNAWKSAYNRFCDPSDTTSEDYELWKLQYPRKLREGEELASKHLEEKYSKAIEQMNNSYKIDTVTEIIRLYERMLKAGVRIQMYYAPEYAEAGIYPSCTSFSYRQLMSAPDEIADLFTEFNGMINALKQNGIEVITKVHSDVDDTYKDFYILHSPTSTAILKVARVLQATLVNGEFESDLDRLEYEADLKQFEVPIEA